MTTKNPCRRTRTIQPNYTSSTIRLFKKEIPRMQNAEVRHLIVDQLPNTCYCEEESISAN